MGSLPTGTATFLFSDIEGSTHLLQTLGERFRPLLEVHNRLLREAILAHAGVVPRTEGDSFFAVFPSALNAVATAVAIQRGLAGYAWPEGSAVRVRLGLHTGEATVGGDDYVGLDVHRAARIAAAGHGGQTLVSDTTYALVRGRLPDGVTAQDLGEHRLKDLPRPERIYQLDVEGLPQRFPTLRTLDATQHNLPVQLTSFVGRESELADARRLLAETRLLTLTGPGGTGKTRLSLEVAAQSLDLFPDGVFFAPLAPIREAELVASALLQALGLQSSGARLPREQVAEYLRDKRLLLVLDNFEQVLDAAPLVGDLLRAAPGVKAIVTSRAALHVYGEREMPVPPLRLPDPAALPSLEALSHYEAVRLFIERAMAVKPSFQVTNDNAPAVAAICARLDGLPLAIELAAARVKLLPPESILRRLEHRLGLLDGGSRDLPARQQTLRGAIAWSFDLLDEPMRRLFTRISVFAGSASLEMVDRVCGPAEELGTDLLDGVEALVDHSLLRQDEVAGEPRFSMLETIREFAFELLTACDEQREIRQRHAVAFLVLAEQAAPRLTGTDQKTWLDTLEREHDNLRAALDWCIETDAADTAMRLVTALWRFWHMRGHLHEARERTARVLALPHGADHPEARLKALEAAGGLAYWQGDQTASGALYREALALARQMGDDAAIANALYNLSFSYVVTDAESRRRGAAILGEALELYRRLGDQAGTAKVLWGLSTAAAFDDMHELSLTYAAQCVPLFRALGDQFSLGWALHMQGINLTRLARPEEARPSLAEALALFQAAGDVSGVVLLLDDFAELETTAGDLDRAARLAGAAAALEHTSGVELASLVNTTMRTGRPGERPDDATLSAAYAAGKAMKLDEAVAFAGRTSLNAVE